VQQQHINGGYQRWIYSLSTNSIDPSLFPAHIQCMLNLHRRCAHSSSLPLRTFFIIAAAHILHHRRCTHFSSSPLRTFFIIAAAHILHHRRCTHFSSSPLRTFFILL